MKEISYVSVVLFIACGLLVFVIIFLFAKRQITLFTLRSSRNPHIGIGTDAPMKLKQEIERRLRRVSEIKTEPKLMSQKHTEAFQSGKTSEDHYLFRMKALDSLYLLEQEARFYDSKLTRKLGQPLRQFLLGLLSGPLWSAKSEMIHDFADAYDCARHDPAKFSKKEYENYMFLMNELIECIKTQTRSRRNSSLSGVSATSQTALITANQSTPSILEVKYRRTPRSEDAKCLVESMDDVSI